MTKMADPSTSSAELRRRAEVRLKERNSNTAELPSETSEGDSRRLVHELQVHQLELEMQNEELQQSRMDLQAGLEKYSDLYDFAPVGYVTFDGQGLVQEANVAAASLLGIERSDLVQRRLGNFIPADDQPAFNAFLAQIFESTTRRSCELKLLKNGESPVEVRLEAIAAATGRECRAVISELTEQRRGENDRLILNKLECTGILAGGLAHDFNNLLTVMLLNLELARMLGPHREELTLLLEDAKHAALTAGELTRQLLAFAKGGMPVQKPTQLPILIRESARTALSGSSVRCEFCLPDDLAFVSVDEGQLRQVVTNLILNARESMPGGGTIAVDAQNAILGGADHLSLPPGDYVRLSIADSGVGIPDQVLAKVFDPYFSTKQRGDQKGMGLGLTICHTIMRRHGGGISVDSKLGVGTTFHLYLPACGRSAGAQKPPVAMGPVRPGRILVMDDEAGISDLLGALLRRMSHKVEIVEDAHQALEAYQRAKDLGRPFDAVLLDLTVRAGPGGIETLQNLLKMDPTVRAIVMSGYASDPAVLEPGRHGFKGVLPKPFDEDDLRRVLGSVMGTGP